MDKTAEEAKRCDQVSSAVDVIAKNLKTDRVSICNSINYYKFLEALVVMKHVSLSRKAKYGKAEKLASILTLLEEEVLEQAKVLAEYEMAEDIRRKLQR